MFIPPNMSRVMCHMLQFVSSSFSSDNLVKLIGGGSVINGAYPVYFLCPSPQAVLANVQLEGSAAPASLLGEEPDPAELFQAYDSEEGRGERDRSGELQIKWVECWQSIRAYMVCSGCQVLGAFPGILQLMSQRFY